MTLDELKQFCLDNAAKIVSGESKPSKTRPSKTYSGRLLAYAGDVDYILIEQSDMAIRAGTLEKAPYEHNGWTFVVGGECHLGAPCVAESVRLSDAGSIQSPVQPKPEIKATKAKPKCGHSRCIYGFCAVSYCGFPTEERYNDAIRS